MVRYVVTAAAGVLLLAVALRSRAPEPCSALEIPAGDRPVVRLSQGPEGRQLTVTHHMLGSVSRASLVYELDGRERTAARQTDCQKSLDRATDPFRDNGYATEVRLSGHVPDGARNIRLVLEAETGTTVLPLQLP